MHSEIQMTSEDLEDCFEDAASCVQAAVTSGHELSTDDKLEIYGLYKQALEGDCASHRPSFLDFKGRPKWDAWKKLNGMPQTKAKLAYVHKVQSLFPQQDKENGKDVVTGPSGGGAVVSTLMTTEPDPHDSLVMGRLHQFAQEGDEAQLAHALSQGADPNEPDSDGNAPLHWASDRGSLQCIRTLLEWKADIEFRNEDGQTPLHFAAISGQLEAVKLLLSAGSNPDVVDSSGESARDAASHNRRLQDLFPT